MSLRFVESLPYDYSYTISDSCEFYKCKNMNQSQYMYSCAATSLDRNELSEYRTEAFIEWQLSYYITNRFIDLLSIILYIRKS